MDPITQQGLAGSAGVAGGDPVYVDDVFSTFLYKGNNNISANVINNGIDLSSEGGLVWIKDRGNTGDHFWYDTERGIARYLRSSSSNSETNTSNYGLQSYNSNGFSLGGNWLGENATNADLVSWTFRKAPGFFDVVTYTGNGSPSGQTISHNLDSIPGMIIIKRVNTAEAWAVFHRSTGNNYHMRLQSHVPGYTQNKITGGSATSFQVMDADGMINGNGDSYVAYLFAHDDARFGENNDESIIKCGTFNSDSNGHYTVDLGFEPQFLLIKQTSGGGGNWLIADSMRGMGVASVSPLYASNTSSEGNSPGEGYLNLQPNGFKSTLNFLGASQTFIYMAIRRPHKPHETAAEVFHVAQSIANAVPTAVSPFPVDMAISTYAGGQTQVRANSARLMQGKQLYMDVGDAQTNTSNFNFDYQNGVRELSINGYDHYMFRRSPGFFDVVTWTGDEQATGSDGYKIQPHGLGVAPELIIMKNRTNTWDWWSWHKDLTHHNDGTKISKYVMVSTTDAELALFSPTGQAPLLPDANNFYLASGTQLNQATYPYIAYLFASKPGISKVGVYTGTGNNIDVDCGFTSGARFVLIKRIDSASNWYVFDTVNGITSGNDNFFALDDRAVYSMASDYIDPLNAGFTVTAPPPQALNTNGGKYIFLAIA